MRRALEAIYENLNAHKNPQWFEALVDVFGESKDGSERDKVCLKNVYHDGELVTGHLWVAPPNDFAAQTGETIVFRAYVHRYARKDGSYDYTLAGLRKVQRLGIAA